MAGAEVSSIVRFGQMWSDAIVSHTGMSSGKTAANTKLTFLRGVAIFLEVRIRINIGLFRDHCTDTIYNTNKSPSPF